MCEYYTHSYRSIIVNIYITIGVNSGLGTHLLGLVDGCGVP